MEEYDQVSALLRRQPKASKDSMDYMTTFRSVLPQVSAVKSEDAQKVIDALNETMDSIKMDPDLFRQSLRALRKICGSTGNLPSSRMLGDGLTRLNDVPVTTGGYADVWKGTYGPGDALVAIKALRMYRTDDPNELKKKFCKEVVVWMRLSHPNVLPLLGFSTSLFPLCMVSLWMENGNVIEYVRSKSGVNRILLLIDVGKGLQYLHSFDIVHGDLKGANVLIDGNGQALLADFGLTAVVSNFNSINASTLGSCPSGTVRWMAPEVLDPESCNVEESEKRGLSQASDVYAFAMVAIEVFTGAAPFHELRNDTLVIVKVMQGGRPSRPAHEIDIGLSDEVWHLIVACWQQDRDKRPNISAVLGHLQSPQGRYRIGSLANFDLSSKKSSGLISSALSSKVASTNSSPTSDVHDAQAFIDALDQAMSSSNIDQQLVQEYLFELLRSCNRARLLPSSHQLPAKPEKSDDETTRYGLFANVWKGTYDNRAVAIKVYRYHKRNRDNIIKMCFNEILFWKYLAHGTNIVPFIGTSRDFVPETPDEPPPFCLVSPWMSNGALTEYLRIHPKANLLQLWSDVGNGLQHLHSLNIVHGDLRGDHVLIDDASRARISGFSHSIIIHADAKDSFQHGVCRQESVRWMAPEIILANNSNTELHNGGFSKASDVYAFSMIFTEIFTGKIPFHHLDDETVIIGQVIGGARPGKNEHIIHSDFSPSVWELVEACWQQEASRRPEISLVIDSLQTITRTDTLSSAENADFTCRSEKRDTVPFDTNVISSNAQRPIGPKYRCWKQLKSTLRKTFSALICRTY